MVAWEWMRMYKVKRAHEVEVGYFPVLFIVQDGGIIKLDEGDVEVACIGGGYG